MKGSWGALNLALGLHLMLSLGGGAAKDWDTREEAAKRRSLLTDPLY